MTTQTKTLKELKMNEKQEWEKEKQKHIEKIKKNYGFDIEVDDYMDGGRFYFSIIENNLTQMSDVVFKNLLV